MEIDGQIIPQSYMKDIYENSSVMGFCGETIIRYNHPNFTKGSQSDCDHIDETGQKYEQKNAGKKGCITVGPSRFYGVGRKFDVNIYEKYKKSKIFILTKLENGIFKYVFKKAEELDNLCTSKNKDKINNEKTKEIFK